MSVNQADVRILEHYKLFNPHQMEHGKPVSYYNVILKKKTITIGDKQTGPYYFSDTQYFISRQWTEGMEKVNYSDMRMNGGMNRADAIEIFDKITTFMYSKGFKNDPDHDHISFSIDHEFPVENYTPVDPDTVNLQPLKSLLDDIHTT